MLLARIPTSLSVCRCDACLESHSYRITRPPKNLRPHVWQSILNQCRQRYCDGMNRAVYVLKSFMALVRDVIVPRGCAGCGEVDAVLCDACWSLMHRFRMRSLYGCSLDHAYACAGYEGSIRTAILQWKDHGDLECDRVFAGILADLIMQCADIRAGPVVLIPTPSSHRSMRARGRWHTKNLTQYVARELRGRGVEAHVRTALSMTGKVEKSVAGSAGRRSGRLRNHIRVDLNGCGDADTVILIDDIITTGATMSQCINALQTAGLQVDAAVALAATNDIRMDTG